MSSDYRLILSRNLIPIQLMKISPKTTFRYDPNYHFLKNKHPGRFSLQFTTSLRYSKI